MFLSFYFNFLVTLYNKVSFINVLTNMNEQRTLHLSLVNVS